MEEDLKPEEVTPELVKSFNKPTKSFLCPLSANTVNVRFVRYKIRDITSGIVLVDIQDDSAAGEDEKQEIDEEDDEQRTIKYQFGPDFLKLKTIGTELEFTVGKAEVKGFLMIEKHFFKDTLLKEVEFNFGFCIPGSRNSWEVVYDMPELSPEMHKEMISSPWETRSDSFFFANGKLIMHTKAEYDYSPFE